MTVTVVSTPHECNFPKDPAVGTWVLCDGCGKYFRYELTPYETLPMYIWMQYPKWWAKRKIRKNARRT